VEQLEEQSVAPAAAVVEYAIRIANASKLNLADFQNSVPLLRELAIVNDSESGLSHLQLRLESFPPFLKPKTWTMPVMQGRTTSSRIATCSSTVPCSAS